jgi:hypothetical protein
VVAGLTGRFIEKGIMEFKIELNINNIIILRSVNVNNTRANRQETMVRSLSDYETVTN